jgi:DNA modification methylase
MDLLHDPDAVDDATVPKPPSVNRANDLSGSDWTRFSISIWSDIRWTSEEQRLSHPAMFPTLLIERLMRTLMRPSDTTVLDPFMGSGSTLVTAKRLSKSATGFEVYRPFIDLANERLGQDNLFATGENEIRIVNADARHLDEHVEPGSFDFCVTSPPYWNILTQKRSADQKEIRNYGDDKDCDLGLVDDYDQFLDELARVFRGVFQVLKAGKYCVVNVMDLRKGPQFYPFHSDLTRKMTALGFILDDIIIWDRRQEYNNLRALGYPTTFRVNKVHEFLLIFLKPKESGT